MKQQLRLSATVDMRLVLGLTQKQLADSLGISRESLAHAENGRRPMPKSVIPVLMEMMLIAKKMLEADTYVVPVKKDRKMSKRSNNRVAESARLHTTGKKPFVTAQSSKSMASALPIMTGYNSRTIKESAFKTSLPETYTDCKKLLHQLSVKQNRSSFHLEYLRLEAKNAVTRGKELSAELLYVNTMIQSNLNIIATFPLTPAKRKLEHRNAKLHCKRLILEDRMEHFDAGAMLMREFTMNVLVRQLELLEKMVKETRKKLQFLSKDRSTVLAVVPGNTIPIKNLGEAALLQKRA